MVNSCLKTCGKLKFNWCNFVDARIEIEINVYGLGIMSTCWYLKKSVRKQNGMEKKWIKN